MKKIVVAAGLVLVVLASLAGWRYGRPAYRHYKERRFLRLAHSFLEKSEYQDAWLSLRSVLALNQTNLEASRMMAELAELSRSPQAVVWRRRVAELEPTVDNRLTLASCALHYEPSPFVLATKTLEGLSATASNNPAFYAVSAERAIRLNFLAEAQQHLRQAMRLEPTNLLHALNLSVLRLQSTNTGAAAEARAQLESLSSDAQYGLVTLRSLAADRINHQDWAAALRFSSRALTNPHSGFSDRIQHLSILREAGNGEWPSYLASLQTMAATNPADIADVGTWLNTHNQAADAVTWVRSLPDPMQARMPVPLVLADAYLSTKDWGTLQKWLRDQKWQDEDFLRLALLARAWKEQDAASVAQANWSKAVGAASGRSELLAQLANVAQGWGWTNEVNEVLWEAARGHKDAWALQALEKANYLRGNTPGLMKVYSLRVDQHPNDPLAMNNLAMVSMLLRTNLDKAHALARDAYAPHQTNASIASTYAFSLFLQGKTNESLAVMGKLKENDLRLPATAVYYAYFLSAIGDTQKSRIYRALAERAPLLPEERTLLGK